MRNPALLRPVAKVTGSQARAMNRRLVLQMVLSEGEISRAELARATKLTKPTISELVQELIDEELLEEAGTGVSQGGKPPTLLRFRADGRELIALDLSREVMHGYRTDLSGRILQREGVDPGGVGEVALAAALDLAERLVAGAAAPLLGIAVGTPGRVSEQGAVIEAANLGWVDIPLSDLMAERTGVSVHVGNDVQVSALDEYGRDGGLTNLVFLHVGTGIGAGIILNGHLHRGDSGAAGELGHVQVVPGGRRCSCGRHGCLETVASIPSLLAAAGLDPHVDLHHLGASERNHLAAVLDTAAEYLAEVLAPLVAGLDVGQLVVGGPAESFGARFRDLISARLQARLPDAPAGRPVVRASTVGGDAVLAGAWTLLLSRELGVMRQ